MRIRRKQRETGNKQLTAYQVTCIGMGTRGAVAPPTKLLEEQLVHPAPPFFCNLQIKVTLDCKVTFNKNSRKLPSFWGLCPRPHCTPHIPFSKNTYCTKLYFEFDCLDLVVFHQFLLPQPKSRSHAYGNMY